MNQLDYKKKYNEALERMKSWARGEYPECFTEARKPAEFIFPELKESEDERMITKLLKHFDWNAEYRFTKEDCLEATQWLRLLKNKVQSLEKQSEQKPILEVFGFKVGDVVRLKDGDGRKHIIKSFKEVEGIHGHNFYQVEFEDNSARDGIYPGEEYPNGYYTQMEKFKKEQNPVDEAEPKFKIEKDKWYVCIKDLFDNYADKAFCEGEIYLCTQDGRLIPSNSNVPYEVTCPDTYFRDWKIQDAKDGDVLVDNYDNIVIYQKSSTNLMYHSYCYGNKTCFIDSGGSHFISNSYPATKEQRDLLFQKMKEVGYEWNAEKKELKKIEQKPVEWNEDDESRFEDIIDDLEYEGFLCTSQIEWLKSLKERIKK